MYEWRANAQISFAHVQDDLSPYILRIFEGTFLFDAAHFKNLPYISWSNYFIVFMSNAVFNSISEPKDMQSSNLAYHHKNIPI